MESTDQSEPNLGGHRCDQCNKTYSTTNILHQHKKVHSDPMKYKCTLCMYSTHRKDYLIRHIGTHTKEKPFKCPHPNCSYACSDPSALRTHQKMVHRKQNDNLWKFHCPFSDCQYRAMRKSEMDQHSAIHSDVRSFACDLCFYRAKSKRHVQAHYYNVHSTEKRFKCPEPNCEYACKQKGHLKQHMKRHLDERPFSCPFPECSYKARVNRDLIIHQRTHSGEKPFKCSFCPYSCSQSGHLLHHTRGHTGEKPYSCQSCVYRTNNGSSLIKHTNTMHLGKKYGKRKSSKAVLLNQKSPKTCKILDCAFTTANESNLTIHLNTAHGLPRVAIQKLGSPTRPAL